AFGNCELLSKIWCVIKNRKPPPFLLKSKQYEKTKQKLINCLIDSNQYCFRGISHIALLCLFYAAKIVYGTK
ncbi:MAG: hypothetical protein LBN27_01805, partial [Prevotellaceae bacterium]|nr:hypothetical protein [Prevotellaceae bacterium]